jgi:RND family efflux transporter MFP subunit
MNLPARRIAVLLACTALLSSACSRRPAPQQRVSEENDAVVPVAATAVRTGRLRTSVHVSGIVTAAANAEFLAVAPEPARILEITKQAGDRVGGSEILVRFELAGATNEAARLRAEVARLQAAVENARVQQSRTREFVDRGLVPRSNVDQADRELADAQSALQRAEAARVAADHAVERAIVRAPFAGVIAARLHEPGDVVQASAGDPVLRLVDPGRLEVLATVKMEDIARVLPGASARVATVINGAQLPMIVSVVNPADRTADGGMRIRLTFREPPMIDVDTPVEVDIDAEERQNALFVTPETLINSGGESAVFVAVGDRAQRRRVTTGVANDQGVEITSGLAAGDLVITQGQTALADGARISVALTPPTN